jgi:endonuclease/exonuclease/phosphatase (EEP) superfamily protein YafD
MSANLQNGRASPQSFQGVLARWNPDVVVTQELAPDCAAVLVASHPHGVLRPGIDYSGIGFAARRPVEVATVPLVVRNGLAGLLAAPHWPVGGEEIEIIGVHLTNPLQRPWWRARAIRRREAEALLGREARSHRLVVGDMNATPAWPLYRTLGGLGSDAARAVHTPRRTWAPFGWMPPLLRIDHGFVRGLDVVAVNRVKVGGSDHHALVVDVQLPSPDPTPAG